MIERLQAHLCAENPGDVIGLYRFGSWVTGGLRPDSDIDLVMITGRSLTDRERRGLTELLLTCSGRRATLAPGRPVELTVVVLSDVVPWNYPPRCDYLYGEWLRDEFEGGQVPRPHLNPDLAVLFTTLRQHSAVLQGPDPTALLESVPATDLRRAMHDILPSLLDDLSGDERNVLLTLARVVVTLESGRIVAKDQAATRLLPDLAEPHRSVMELAMNGYRGKDHDDWSDRRADARSTADRLTAWIRTHTSR